MNAQTPDKIEKGEQDEYEPSVSAWTYNPDDQTMMSKLSESELLMSKFEES